MPPRTENTGHSALRPLLKRVGLSEKEASIYLALLSLRQARATDIANAAKESRSHTYLILKALEEKGLIAKVERGNVLHFVAEPPQRLLSYLKERGRDLVEVEKLVEAALPALESITSPLVAKPRVTLLSGIEGVKHVYRDVLTQKFHGIFNPEAMYKAFGCNIVTKIFGPNVRLRGRDLFTNNPAGRRFASELTQHEEYEIHLLPKGILFNTDTLIYGDSIALFAYDTDATIIRIESKNLADAFRAWHEVLWNASTSAPRSF